MIYDDRQYRQNLLLTLLLLLLAAWLGRSGSEEGLRQAGLVVAGTLLLWRRSGRGGPPDQAEPPGAGMGTGTGAALPVLCLAALALSACRAERLEPAWPWCPPAPSAAPSALLEADGIEMKPKASAPSCTSGRACLYSLSADGLFYTKEGSTTLKLHSATAFRTSADCSALSSPANGDVCYDTSLSVFRYYSGGWATGAAGDSLLLHKAGTETATGDKTFTGALVLPQSSSPAQTAEGSIAWDTDDNLLTVGDGASRKTMVDTGSARLPLAPSAAGKLPYDTGSAYGLTAAGTATQVLHGAAGAPTWGAVALASDVSGILPAANGGTGVATCAQNTVLAASASGTSALGCRLLVGSDLGTIVAHTAHDAGGTGALGAATVYLTAPGQVPSATEVYLGLARRSATVRNLYCRLGTAPGGADTVTFTVRAAGADTAVTCQIAAAATTCNSASLSASVAAGDRQSIKAVSSAGVAADATCSFEETN